MPDRDWDADEQEARADFAALTGEGIQNSADDVGQSLLGWDAAIEWVKRSGLLRMLGGPVEVVCDRTNNSQEDVDAQRVNVFLRKIDDTAYDRCGRCGCFRRSHGPGLLCPAFKEKP